MDTLTLILPPETYRRLKKKAKQAGQPPEILAQELLTRQLSRLAEKTEHETTSHVLHEASLQIGYRPHVRPASAVRPDAETEREKLTCLLREAGMLSEIGPRMRRLVETTPVKHNEVVAILSRTGGKPLSEIILEQRGPKLQPLIFVAADNDLLKAARAEGLATENPNDHP